MTYRRDDRFDPTILAGGDNRRGGEDAIVVCLAGTAAGRRLDPDASPSLARSDREVAQELALALNGGDKDLAGAHLSYLELRADSLVASRWRVIEALASTLMSKGVIGARERSQLPSLSYPAGA
jgi:hypothetical protein